MKTKISIIILLSFSIIHSLAAQDQVAPCLEARNHIIQKRGLLELEKVQRTLNAEFKHALENKRLDMVKSLIHAGVEIAPALLREQISSGVSFQILDALLDAKNIDAKFLNELRLPYPVNDKKKEAHKELPLLFTLLGKDSNLKLDQGERVTLIRKVLEKGLDVYLQGDSPIRPWQFMMKENRRAPLKFLLRQYKPKYRDDARYRRQPAAAPAENLGAFELSPLIEARNSPANLMEVIASVFRDRPKKTINILVDKGQIEDTPEDRASFLYKHHELLGSPAIGEYLSEQNNREVLTAFMKKIDFKDKGLAQALRSLVTFLNPPGESQKIDRVMDAFGEEYARQNQSYSKDMVYIMSFSLMMLNTDLHNKSVKHHMSFEEYLKNVRRIPELNSFDDSFIANIYQDLKREELKLLQGPANGGGPSRQDLPIILGWRSSQLAGLLPRLSSESRKTLSLYSTFVDEAQQVLHESEEAVEAE